MPARAPGPHVRYSQRPRWRRGCVCVGVALCSVLVPVVPGSCVCCSESDRRLLESCHPRRLTKGETHRPGFRNLLRPLRCLPTPLLVGQTLSAPGSRGSYCHCDAELPTPQLPIQKVVKVQRLWFWYVPRWH